MPRFSTGVVSAILSERDGLQRVEVDGERAYVLTDLIGPVAIGDPVVINTTAVQLGLGTGGWHVVHWNLARSGWTGDGGGSVMKLRYTSLQCDVGAAEESADGQAKTAIGEVRTPVVVCALHSQVACVAVVFGHLVPEARLVYVMTDSAALPLALSDLTAALRARGLLEATVTSGQSFGGDYEAVNVHSALEVAHSLANADAIVVGPGPGIVGTGTVLGFSDLEVAGVLDAASALGAHAVAAVRYSDADHRDRHRGVSHHTTTSLRLAARPALVAVPTGSPSLPALDGRHDLLEVDVPDVGELLRRNDLRVTTMGRGPEDDPGFFRYGGAAGAAAARLLQETEGADDA